MTIPITFDPIIAQLGPIQLGWHGVFTALAVAVAVWLGVRQAMLRGFPEDQLSAIATWAIVGGLIGARLFHVLDHLPYFLDHPLEVFAIWQGGIAAYGGFIGGIVGGLIPAWRAALPVWSLLDAVAPAMLVGQAIGRLGCLSNGDAWGAPCSCPLCACVVYNNPHDLLPAALHGVPTYPYPAYEIVAVLLLLVALVLARGRLRQPGDQFLIAALGYAVIRFGLTYLREETIVLWGLQEAQVVALVTGLLAVGILFVRGLGARSIWRSTGSG